MSITFSSGGSSITLPNPVFGNDETQVVNKAVNISRHGTVRMSCDVIWPDYSRMKLTFDNISDTACPVTISDIKDYFYIHINGEQTLTDMNGDIWIGCITEPLSLSHVGKDKHSFSVTFEGKLQ